MSGFAAVDTASAVAVRLRDAVQSQAIGPDKDIPQFSHELIVKYLDGQAVGLL